LIFRRVYVILYVYNDYFKNQKLLNKRQQFIKGMNILGINENITYVYIINYKTLINGKMGESMFDESLYILMYINLLLNKVM